MVLDIQSKEVIDKISDELKVQPALQIPRRLMDKIQLVYNVNPKPQRIRVETVTRASTGASLVFASDATKRTFLTGFFLSYQHDVVADSTAIIATITPLGRAVEVLLNFAKITLTAKGESAFIKLDPPVELEPGANVTITQTFTVGAGQIAGTAYFYETDPQ